MYGYVRARKPDMKIKDYEVYRGFYCGLCDELKRKYSFAGQLTLTYDMTFLIILLTSVYDLKTDACPCHCIIHPVTKRLHCKNAVSTYAADIGMFLTYHHFADDHRDEKAILGAVGMRVYHGSKNKAMKDMPEKKRAMLTELKALSEMENRREKNIDKLAGCFGRLLSEAFAWKQDVFEKNLRLLGYHLGRFIYIMDAWDDRDKDRENGSFNPLLDMKEDGLEERVYDMLESEMSAASAAYRRLPVIEYKEILDNIIYAGVWCAYDNIDTKGHKVSKRRACT